MDLGHKQGLGAPCLKCKEKCSGFELHFWKKICCNCKCRPEEHDILLRTEEDRKVGKLFEDDKYTTLITKLVSEGIHMYNRYVPILTDAVRKKVSTNTPTHKQPTPFLNQALTRQYMKMQPREKQPVSDSEAAQYQKHLVKQLPAHNQDPSKFHDLSLKEVTGMEQFVKKYNSEALEVGGMKLSSEMNAQCCKVHIPAGIRDTPVAVDSKDKSKPTQYSCYCCKHLIKNGDPAVFAERAGYDKLWHPDCFICSTCGEILVNLVYFWKNEKLYCGRHYFDSEKPRCAGCDELIFSNEYAQAENKNWHLRHFSCFDCNYTLAGKLYVMVSNKPVCKPCYMKNHAEMCQGCHYAIDPEVQRITYNNFSWHASTDCFLCSYCRKCLLGQKFIPAKRMVFCSVDCKEMMS